MSRPRKIEVLYIEWVDSSYAAGWKYQSEDDVPARIHSVGIVSNRAANSVTIATSTDSNGGYLQQVTIPRCAIKKVRKVACK